MQHPYSKRVLSIQNQCVAWVCYTWTFSRDVVIPLHSPWLDNMFLESLLVYLHFFLLSYESLRCISFWGVYICQPLLYFATKYKGIVWVYCDYTVTIPWLYYATFHILLISTYVLYSIGWKSLELQVLSIGHFVLKGQHTVGPWVSILTSTGSCMLKV